MNVKTVCMDIKQFKEFKRDFVFKGILEEKALLIKVKNSTFLDYVTNTCNTIENRLLNSKRTKHDKNGIIFFSYVMYLCEFTSGMHDNFDKILKWINKDVNTYVNDITLAEILNK